MVEVMKIMATSFKRSHAGTAAFSASDLIAGHHQPMPLLETPGHSRANLGQPLAGSLLLSPEFWSTQGSVCALPRVLFPQSCLKLWQLCGGVNGDLPEEGLCHTQVCCTQSPCPCGRPLLTNTFTGDTQTRFWLSLCGVSGPWCAEGLFEPSEHLWPVRGLIPNVISPLLPSCWGFSFACGHGVSLLVGSNILQWTVVQRRVVVLEFLQEKTSTRPPTPPSYATDAPRYQKSPSPHSSFPHYDRIWRRRSNSRQRNSSSTEGQETAAGGGGHGGSGLGASPWWMPHPEWWPPQPETLLKQNSPSQHSTVCES